MSYLLEAATELLIENGQGSAVSEKDGVVIFVEPGITITQEQIAAKAAQMQADQVAEWKALRMERDRLIAETDWVVTRAVDASNDGLGIQLPQVWVDYRQALRDLPANTVDPVNPVWPVKPSS